MGNSCHDITEAAEESRAYTCCVRSMCQATNSVSTTALPLPLLQKKITWDGKGINGWGRDLQLKSESLSVGTKTKLYTVGAAYVVLEASSDQLH